MSLIPQYHERVQRNSNLRILVLSGMALALTTAAVANDPGRLTINAPRILVANVKASYRFYEKLGLKCTYGNINANFVEFATGNETIQLFRRDLMPQSRSREHRSDRVVLVFETDNVDIAYRSLLAKGIRFAQIPTDMPTWQSRIALLRDPDGNLLEINGPLSTVRARH